MLKPNRNDIRIGKDKWIKFIELDDTRFFAFKLDEILVPIQSFLDLLETECVAECCGISAYALSKEDIQTAVNNAKIPDLLTKLTVVRNQIIEAHSESFVSHRMNNYFHIQTLLELIDHISLSVSETGVWN